jgi:probable F420-dependent oxidoreductase
VLVEVAREAEALGYDSIWTTDHVMMTKGQEEPYGHILEALTALTYAAALTERVRLGVSVIVVPQREPVLLAKQVATLDNLSGGRVILGLGAGWNQREFRYLNASFDDRGKRLDEYIRAMRELWTSPEPRFEGQFVQFSDGLFSPRSAQPNGVPIWIGGSSRAALRRSATLADGWHPVGASVEAFAAGMQQVRELAGERKVEGTLRIRTVVGRRLPEQRGANGQVQGTLGGAPDEIAREIRGYERAGLSHLVAHFGENTPESYLDDMRRFAREVRPALES